MRVKIYTSLLTGMIVLLSGNSATAHHGRAAYTSDLLEVKATIIEFRFINPHVQVMFDFTDANGEVQHWHGELTAPNRMARGGWTKNSLQPGDKVTFTGFTARNKGKAMVIRKMVLPDGTDVPLRETLE
jgi:hypothetical protein